MMAVGPSARILYDFDRKRRVLVFLGTSGLTNLHGIAEHPGLAT